MGHQMTLARESQHPAASQPFSKLNAWVVQFPQCGYSRVIAWLNDRQQEARNSKRAQTDYYGSLEFRTVT